MKTKIIILLVIFLAMPSMAMAVSNYYEINLIYNDSRITYEYAKVGILQADEKIGNLPGSYNAEIVASDNTILNTTPFRIPLQILYDHFDENGTAIGGGEITKNYTTWIIILPYYENAKQINIYDENMTKKLTIDVKMYAKNITTEEGLSEQKENITGESEKTTKAKTTNTAIIIGISAIIIIMAFLIILRIRKKAN